MDKISIKKFGKQKIKELYRRKKIYKNRIRKYSVNDLGPSEFQWHDGITQRDRLVYFV